jgi:uncharacterized membrane protein
MSATLDRTGPRALHPFHAVLLAATIPPFLGALLSDIAYAQTFEIQWSNFASWLIVGGLVFTGLVLVFALVDLIRADHRTRRSVVYFGFVLALFVLGFINSLIHAKDAWASMPDGLVLSAVVSVLACVATWLGFSGYRAGGVA